MTVALTIWLVALILVCVLVGALLAFGLVAALAWAIWRSPRKMLRALAAANPTVEVAVLTVAEDLIAASDASTPIEVPSGKYKLH